MLRRLYQWVLKLAAGPKAEPALFAVSFAESSFFPIPPDVMLAPMALARPERAWRYALVCTLASLLGAAAGYAIGAFAFDLIGERIISLFGYAGKEEELRAIYERYGLWFTLVAGFTPVPFKLVTIVSGAMSYSFLPFIAACAVTRGARFFLVAWLFKTFGPTLAPVIERRIGMVSLALVAAVVGAVILVRFIH
ncbi:MAG: YqaA family protein [Hyphomonadaceae bacterium]